MRGPRNRLAVVLRLWSATTPTPPISFVPGGAFDGVIATGDVPSGSGQFVVGSVVARHLPGSVTDPASRFRDGLETVIDALDQALPHHAGYRQEPSFLDDVRQMVGRSGKAGRRVSSRLLRRAKSEG
ncbi:hypothetical protein [Natrinema caseinilyticum]|uniref:hypothetical protein n=1 Tax=Natrinema caseinilyticum TaxID=2961570 RepID=UPI0020C26A54|nr:hypothetical protein [Natrinema caseinilyticum]